ncbi:omptin family outer membrane protease [uncultured Ilyobacter sp.]|uniref:omptin family outer membrane protease n=1 Tax=uncultured Ilyobacter sp. TaxID=544433 RepID=UPI0029C6750A|nr:omptin family outer membrane protease [uncultured Ilyobacter sp.]
MQLANIKNNRLALLAAFFMLTVSNSYSMSATSNEVFMVESESRIPVSISISTGILNGESKEYVYDNFFGTDQKVSELTWDLDNVLMIGAETSVGLTDRILFNFGAWLNASDGSDNMTDYDWRIGEDEGWTDYSSSSSDLEEGIMLDANLNILILAKDNYSLSTVFGFRYDKFRWSSYDGSGVYSYGDIANDKLDNYVYDDGTMYDDGFRIQDVELYGDNIDYEQKFFTPYIGLNFNYRKNKWIFNSYIRGSIWAWGEAEDIHYYPAGTYTLNGDFMGDSAGDSQPGSNDKDSIFYDSVDNMYYISLGLGVDYLFTETFSMGLSVNFQKYYLAEDNDKKDIEYDYHDASYESWGGMSHESYMITLSANYSL